MQSSSRRGISFPSLDRSDRPDVPAHIKNLVDAIEKDPSITKGVFSSRPSNPGYSDYFYWATDQHLMYYWDGSSWFIIGTTDAISASLIDAKGDLLAGLADNTAGRLAVGANGKILVADSTKASGLDWIINQAIDLIASKGDLLLGTAVDTLARQAVGADGTTLIADSAQTTGVRWDNPVISRVIGNQTADQAMTNQMQFYDGASVSVGAGTWLFLAHHLHVISGSNPIIYTKLWDGTNVLSTAEEEGSGTMRQLINIGVASPTTTTTYKVSAAGTSGGANGGTLKTSTGQPNGNFAGILVALRIA